MLIVDDVAANRAMLSDLLTSLGFRIAEAENGWQAVERAQADRPDAILMDIMMPVMDGLEATRCIRAQFVQPDLILLDVMMPGIDGFETCRRLKAIDSVRDIPVIFMTALTYVSDKVTAFSAGGVDYVTKPLQIEEVQARIRTHLALRRMQKQLGAKNIKLQQEVEVRQRAEQSLTESY